MIVITGGAGFIGSCMQEALHARGVETVVVDWLGSAGKWRNLRHHAPARIIAPEALAAWLATGPDVEAVIHLGAISETTATDGDLVWRTNVDLSMQLAEWCAQAGVRFIYASSAATYGAADRVEQFSDDPAGVDRLSPLNLYGWSKQAFDSNLLHRLGRGELPGLSWAGLKFFNVYGPNEYHKGRMISVVRVKYDEARADQPLRLFRSDVPGLADGAQARDFIWVGDVVDVMLWLLEHRHVSGLFNCGTGVARTYVDLAHAVCDAAGVARQIEFIDMPESLRGQYQSFTCADMRRLRAAGYTRAFTTLEDGVSHYVQSYLARPDPYL
ncbi:ADP-glyceromanno-heptose 6-epimerase [Komagataeibacter medellinensis]|uniref:ADP-L-glycero-D-manno-heptose-6-epimerase n=1 Tax=Komagataeibacter medellinensis (strain NBRC 3288 / BCRC 11682 / LMG 1693 / Kondo 51) TaxID=634177 RepID=G2I110_KOMMN|nr:ADP-glyceromanno-heptose 6-epimerase [Komagataeibacter medellinensis]BAK84618.1 ADP-L-glycero-D-manno-heptose-6-epimerase [Komagataeibacter medellinensis NBRC 3288]